MNGVIFDIKRYSINDGPGIRTTVFFKGCPLRCAWCHNPEGQDPNLELIYRESRCIGCLECLKDCPSGALSQVGKRISLNRTECVFCGNCWETCQSEALSIVGREVTSEEIMKEVAKDVVFYEESGGGVTFSGGEPLLQADFLSALTRECMIQGIHVAVDTCGCVPFEAFDRLLDRVDLFLYDIKFIDDERHRRYSGASNQQILENLRRLAENGSNVTVRLPIIPSINDDNENVERTAGFLASLSNVRDVDLLPYHRAGIEKYRSLGRSYKLGKIRPPSKERIGWIKEKLEAYGLRVEAEAG